MLTRREGAMRTNIEIDKNLIKQVMKKTGAPTNKAVVEAGLRLQLNLEGQKKILSLRGKVEWEADLERSRLGHIED
jgi:Arc/MetJ family transcription regulator